MMIDRNRNQSPGAGTAGSNADPSRTPSVPLGSKAQYWTDENYRPNLRNDPAYIRRRDLLWSYMRSEVELTEADKQRVAKYREASRSHAPGPRHRARTG